jgi:hypothetical protein
LESKPLDEEWWWWWCSGATAQTGPWPPLRVSWQFVVVRCGVISSTIDLFETPWCSHQRYLVVITRDSRGEARKHGWEMDYMKNDRRKYETSYNWRIYQQAINPNHAQFMMMTRMNLSAVVEKYWSSLLGYVGRLWEWSIFRSLDTDILFRQDKIRYLNKFSLVLTTPLFRDFYTRWRYLKNINSDC